jgi:hypothetical protein
MCRLGNLEQLVASMQHVEALEKKRSKGNKQINTIKVFNEFKISNIDILCFSLFLFFIVLQVAIHENQRFEKAKRNVHNVKKQIYKY